MDIIKGVEGNQGRLGKDADVGPDVAVLNAKIFSDKFRILCKGLLLVASDKEIGTLFRFSNVTDRVTLPLK